MNGRQGMVEDVVFSTGDHPNHDRVANLMLCANVLAFPATPVRFSLQSQIVELGSFSNNQKNKSGASVVRYNGNSSVCVSLGLSCHEKRKA